MRVAVTVWEDAIATVCDFSSRLWLFDVEGGTARKLSAVPFKSPFWVDRVQQLRGFGVQVLLCGALSRPLERMLLGAEIDVIPWLCGSVEEIMQAYLRGGLSSARFMLPGCRGRWEASRPRGGRRWGGPNGTGKQDGRGPGRRGMRHIGWNDRGRE